VYDYGIENHIFSDRSASTRVSARDGWVRIEETRVAADRRKWKRGKRDNQPENEEFTLDKLQKRLQAQLHAGSMPKASRRRPSIAARGNKLLRAKANQQQKTKRVTASLKSVRDAAKA